MKIDTEVYQVWLKYQERGDGPRIAELAQKEFGWVVTRQAITLAIKTGRTSANLAKAITAYYAKKKVTGGTEEQRVNEQLREALQ